MFLSRFGRGFAGLRSGLGGREARRLLRSTGALSSVEVKMPSLSPTMKEGQIVKWLKNEGEAVAAGDVICDIQTDKAVVSLESDDDGTVAKIFKGSDDGTIPIGTLIAVIAEDGEDWKLVAEETGDPDAADSLPDPEKTSSVSGGSTPGTAVKMPALSPTMTEGTIVQWCYKEGEKISAGEVLCEIQTDKAVVSMEVDDDAVLAKIIVREGSTNVKIGSLIAVTVEEGEDWKDVRIPEQEKASPPPAEPPFTASSVTSTAEVHGDHVPGVGPATNLLLTQYGIKPGDVKPSGPKGLVKADVLAHIDEKNLKPVVLKVPLPQKEGKVASAPPAKEKVKRPNFNRPPTVTRSKMGGAGSSATPPPMMAVAAGAKYTDIPLTSMRSVIASRLLQSKQTSPHGYSTAECNIDAIGKVRKDFLEGAGAKISVNDLVVKAVGTALQYVPEVNLNVIGEDESRIMPNVDISVAVATDSGLITPIVKDVPSLALHQISANVRELAGKAREGRLQLHEFQGGTFTISNLGMFGITEFTAIINPPQCAILAVGRGIDEINPLTGVPSTYMKATLSFDRRFIDEHLASEFMSTFRKIIEHPEYMNIGPVPLVRQSARSTSLFN